MALPEDVYGSLVQLRESLDKEGLPVAELPGFHQPTHLFAFWFEHTYFLLVERFFERADLPRSRHRSASLQPPTSWQGESMNA